MKHDFSIVFETENELWQRVLDIFEKNEKYEKNVVSNRNLHHKFPRSFSKMLNEEVDNDKDNLISLSIADHFLIHYYYYLLAKKGFRQRMATAFLLMARKGLKYITPETAEQMAKDYEEAVVISNQYKSELSKGENNPMWGKHFKHTDEAKRKISESSRNMSKETREKISKSQKGKKRSDETKEKLSQSKMGEKNPNYKKISSEFGNKFKEHYGIGAADNKKLYQDEYNYYYKHDKKCRWE